ncbi:hypothetical protein [Anaerofustis stercorihominis]|uniref:Uncharacterized protein n=1 Tax=Anaerofustis stercorihominis TaxID=214853 RepID=A0A3E3DX68_9FIRM|nr:hypothetical protein [Anaerofustis stercorihominis]RGD73840.1 hypothetical protein DW687_08680 [Anaerofustis stercorihominis]
MKYFIFYNCFGYFKSGIGNGFINLDNEITEKDIKDIEKYLKNKYHHKNVVITNFIKIGE